MDVESEFLTGSIRDELPYTEIDSPRPVESTSFRRSTSRRCSRSAWRIATSARASRSIGATTRSCAAATVLAARRGRRGRSRADPGQPARRRAGGRRQSALRAHRSARTPPQHAVLEAMRRVVAVGARPIGLTDCLNFGNPRKPEQYGEFVAAVDGLARAARELGLPFVSGNVSLYNESSDGRAVPASAIVACVGAIDDVANVVTPGLKSVRVRRCFGSGAASSSSAARSSPSCSASKARCRRSLTAANEPPLAIVHDAIARGVWFVVSRDRRRRNADRARAPRLRCDAARAQRRRRDRLRQSALREPAASSAR